MKNIEIFCSYCRRKEVHDFRRLNTLISSVNYLKEKISELEISINLYDDSFGSELFTELKNYENYSDGINIFNNFNQGKFQAIKKFIKISNNNSLLVFTDANTYLCIDSLYELYKKSNTNHHKKLVGGKLIHLEQKEFNNLENNIFCIDLDNLKSKNRSTNIFFKKIETFFNTTAGVNGAFYAIPNSENHVINLIKKEFIQNDDFYISAKIADKIGFCFASNAIAFEESPSSFLREINSKLRDSRGHFFAALSLLSECKKLTTKFLILYRIILWNTPLIIFFLLTFLIYFKLISIYYILMMLVILIIYAPLKILTLLTSFLGFWIGAFKGQLIKW